MSIPFLVFFDNVTEIRKFKKQHPNVDWIELTKEQNHINDLLLEIESYDNWQSLFREVTEFIESKIRK